MEQFAKIQLINVKMDQYTNFSKILVVKVIWGKLLISSTWLPH